MRSSPPSRPGVYLLEGQFAYAEPLRLALQNLALGRPNPSEDSSPGVSLRLLGNGFTAEVAQRLQKIESAVSKQRTIVFPYWAISSDEQSTRTLDPYSLFLRDGQWYLVGRDHDRDAIRTFRLSRIRGDVRFATRRERDFRIPAEFDATQWRDRARLAARRDRRDRDHQGLARPRPGSSSARRAATAPRPTRTTARSSSRRPSPTRGCSHAGCSTSTARPSRSGRPISSTR